jgi:hypothetical protein
MVKEFCGINADTVLHVFTPGKPIPEEWNAGCFRSIGLL